MNDGVRGVVYSLTIGALVSASLAYAQSMLVVEASRDLNGDGKADRVSIWLTQGKKYNDTELWEGAGEKYEGHFVLRVEIAGKMPVTNDLNRLFYPQYDKEQPMFFWSSEPWEIFFADYNHDGRTDFNLGQYGSGVACVFRIFTIPADGRVSELPLEGQTYGLLGPRIRTHSTAQIEPTRDGFTHSYYSRLIGTGVKNWWRWDKDKGLFVLVKQEPPDKRPEHLPGN